jgi:4-hydroxy-tetrahydrodipicolinate synthase
MAAANAGDETTARTIDAPLSGLHRDLFCEANPIPVKWALARIGKTESGIRLPLVQLGDAFHTRVDSALVQAECLAAEDSSVGTDEGGSALSATWPSRNLLLQGHLFDSGLINQALEIIEKRGGDFVVESFYVQPNDQMSREFNWRSKSSVTLKVFGVDNGALDDIISRLHALVEVMESAEGSITEVTAEEKTEPVEA